MPNQKKDGKRGYVYYEWRTPKIKDGYMLQTNRQTNKLYGGVSISVYTRKMIEF